MRAISCPSCDAAFPTSKIPLPNATRCPRCDEMLTGPRRPRFSFVGTKLTPADFIQPAYCSVCGCYLSMIERVGGISPICRFPLCHHKRAAAASLELQQKTIEDLARRAAEDLDRVEQKLQEMGLEPADHDIAILPAFDRSLEKMSERRKSALADKLTEIAADLRLRPIEETTTSFSVASKPTDTAYIAQACTLCRGDCCQNGGEHAYLRRQTLARVLAASPGMSLEDVVRTYLDRVPEESYEGSCIYHGVKGCNLPGEMRSDTCNDFYCSGTRSLSTIICGEESHPVLAAALKGEKIVRLAVINGQEIKYLSSE